MIAPADRAARSLVLRLGLMAGFLGLWWAFGPAQSPALACVGFNSQADGSGVGSFNVYSPNSSVDSTTLGLAGGMWNGCSGSGTRMPSIKIDGTGDLEVTVTLVDGNCPVSGCACGRYQAYHDGTGKVTNAEITLYTKTNSGNSCDQGMMHYSLAHELGHVYGLRNSSCSGYIMSGSGIRTIQPDECSGVESRWKTPWEQQNESQTDDSHPCKTQVK